MFGQGGDEGRVNGIGQNQDQYRDTQHETVWLLGSRRHQRLRTADLKWCVFGGSFRQAPSAWRRCEWRMRRNGALPSVKAQQKELLPCGPCKNLLDKQNLQ